MEQQENTTTENPSQTQEGQQEVNPLDYLMYKIQVLEQHLSMLTTYVDNFNKVANKEHEDFDTWVKRVSQEMKLNPNAEAQQEEIVKVKRKSGIIV